MKTESGRALQVILPSFLVAFILSVATPPWSTTDGPWFLSTGWRPEWSLLLLIYWALMLPQRVGLVSGWLVGLAEDLLHGTPLGLHALTYMLITWFTVGFHQHLRSQALWQQTMSVLLLLGCSQLMQSALGGRLLETWPSMIIVVLVSALLWPTLVLLMNGFKARISH